MQQKSISGKKINKSITSEDILGKDVIDAEGAFIGVAEKVLIDQKSMDFIGISIDKGLIRSGITIGKSYIDKIADHAIFLKIRVVYDIKGKLVFDKDGKKMGTVSSIDIYGKKNKIKNIYMKPISHSFFFKKIIVISADYIETIGDNVILNVTMNNLSKK
ncbi:MAG: PRC-barrel domain-containing protein [Nanoarchaeota archaeon]|nr:PRC-barrel domain-containing protein [Nanoarchaeota archaeon]